MTAALLLLLVRTRIAQVDFYSPALLLSVRGRRQLELDAVNAVDTVNKQYQDEDERYLVVRCLV